MPGSCPLALVIGKATATTGGPERRASDPDDDTYACGLAMDRTRRIYAIHVDKCRSPISLSPYPDVRVVYLYCVYVWNGRLITLIRSSSVLL
jgi:hypothetical protein